ncbi:hypothetical protein OESDEN_15932 [Oesophagostomum dentatum]|uniref:Adenosine deaminase domain-containing protein n=1 Tax=Oesophagostomum dentatum TaxID=61180 RepID=A0A0B1SKD3_OESDE|nr:hypothetical protein OESDEN_15932 [Oesophagostomum dentatum]
MVTEMECRRLPKIELHAHLNGRCSRVFKIFPLIQSLTTSKEAVKTATIDVIREFAEDGVVYLELRSTPKTTSEMSKKDYVDAIIEGIKEGSQGVEMVTKLILSIDRRQSAEEAEQTVEVAAADETGLIVGIELSGNPAIDGRKFLPVLERARSSGLKVSIHLAEVFFSKLHISYFLIMIK